jgi:integrase
MRGTVVRRGKRWSIVYDDPRDENGHRVQVWRSGFESKKDAQQELSRLLSTKTEGTYVAPSKISYGEFLRQWLEAIGPTVRPLTATTYRGIVDRYLRPKLGRHRLQALTPAAINAVYAQLRASGLSAATLRLTHAVLHRSLRDAVRWGMLSRNPADAADPPRQARTRAKCWTASEMRRFLEHVRSDRLGAVYLLAATTGLRRGELLGLRWYDCDLDGGSLSVDQVLLPTRGGLTFDAPKTSSGRRRVALDPATVDALREHRGRQLVERAALGDGYLDHDLVFAWEDGRPINPQRLTDAFRAYVIAAGMRPLTLHGLRHSHASLALAAGIHPKIVSERLGHSSISITLDTYSHTIPTLQETAAAKVAALVLGEAR